MSYTNEIDPRDPGAVMDGKTGGVDAAIRWIGAAVVFVRIESDGALMHPAVYSARVFAWKTVVEVPPFAASRDHPDGIDSPGAFDKMAVRALKIASEPNTEEADIIASAAYEGGMLSTEPGEIVSVRRMPHMQPQYEVRA